MDFSFSLPDLLADAQRIAIFGHQHPDGDCLGACLAFGTLCERLGKDVTYFVPDAPGPSFSFLPKLATFRTDFAYQEGFDLLILLDIAVPARIGNRWLNQPNYFTQNKTLVIDHHISNPCFGQYNIVDVKASSTCEMITELIHTYFPTLLDAELATPLLMGISTDTGNFIYESNSLRSFSAASLLLAHGADKASMIHHLYRSQSYEGFHFLWTLIQRMQRSDKAIRSRYTDAEVSASGIDQEQIGDTFVYMMGNIAHTGFFALCKVMLNVPEPHLRCSLRSNTDTTNVAQLAATLGGWGHIRAAGLKVLLNNRAPEQAIQEMINQLSAQLVVPSSS